MGVSAPPALRGGRADTRRGGDNGTSPRKPEPDSAEARPGEAWLRLGYAFGGFNVWLFRHSLMTPKFYLQGNNRKSHKLIPLFLV